MRKTVLTFASVMLAASCASGSGFLAPDTGGPSSAYGAFLAGRYAGVMRNAELSADYYAGALEAEPESQILSERAFYSALIAGDFPAAGRAARLAVEDGENLQLARIYLQAEAVSDGRPFTAQAEATQLGAFGTLISTMLEDWEAASTAAGAQRVADIRLEVPSQAAAYAIVHKALLYEAARNDDRAAEAWAAAAATNELVDLVTVLRGAFLERRGDRETALALYRERIASDSNPDPEVVEALARVESGRRAPRALRPHEAAARSLYALSRVLIGSAPPDYSALYLRIVQRLDPAFDRNRYALAQVLESLSLNAQAVAIYDGLGDGPFGERAGVDAAWLTFLTGNEDAALSRARALRTDSMAPAPALLLADIYRLTGRCADAVLIYDSVIDRPVTEGDTTRWQPYFFDGVCEQTLGDWPAAEARFLRALELAPDEPRILNHLGYNWIVLNENVERGFEMVMRAAELAPRNGAILDSVGWGHFKQGRPEEAIVWLEQAAELSPANATINWHLGDAYARVGRLLEARFSWQRALDLNPEPREQALIRERLEQGLEGATADLE